MDNEFEIAVPEVERLLNERPKCKHCRCDMEVGQPRQVVEKLIGYKSMNDRRSLYPMCMMCLSKYMGFARIKFHNVWNINTIFIWAKFRNVDIKLIGIDERVSGFRVSFNDNISEWFTKDLYKIPHGIMFDFLDEQLLWK